MRKIPLVHVRGVGQRDGRVIGTRNEGFISSFSAQQNLHVLKKRAPRDQPTEARKFKGGDAKVETHANVQAVKSSTLEPCWKGTLL